jgi:hypothetical protein
MIAITIPASTNTMIAIWVQNQCRGMAYTLATRGRG